MKSIFFTVALVIFSLAFTAPAKAQSNVATVYMDNFKIIRSMGGGMSCDMYFHLYNDTEYDIDRVGIKLKWSGMRTQMSFSKIKPGETGDKHYHLIGKGCQTMGGQPETEVSTCRMRKTIEDEVQRVDDEICKNMVAFQ